MRKIVLSENGNVLQLGMTGSSLANGIIPPKLTYNQRIENGLADIKSKTNASAPIKPPGLFGKIMTESDLGKKLGQFGGIAGAVSTVSSGLQNAIHGNRTGKQQSDKTAVAIKDAQFAVASKIPILAPFAKIAQAADGIFGAIGGGLSSATTADKVLTSMPVVGNFISMFAKKTDTFDRNLSDINSSGEFSSIMNRANDAKDLSGAKSVAANKVNKQIALAEKMTDMTQDTIDFNKKRKNNSIGMDIMAANANKYSGAQHNITLSKHGGLLDDARRILAMKTFKSGGKMDNLIPTGAMHKNLHHIEDNAPELDGKITEKGIPVGVYDEKGNFQQVSEIECGEIIFTLEVTKRLEELFNDGSEEAAIECGRFLVEQILNNTKDDDKIINKTE